MRTSSNRNLCFLSEVSENYIKSKADWNGTQQILDIHEIHSPGQQEDNLTFFKLILFAIIWIRVSIIVHNKPFWSNQAIN